MRIQKPFKRATRSGIFRWGIPLAPLPRFSTLDTWQPGETNLDEGGELTKKCPRNRFEIRQIRAFWPGQRTRGAGRGLCRWNECEKGGEPGTQGCILSSPDKQNGNPGLKVSFS
jgi:hypothetical protein